MTIGHPKIAKGSARRLTLVVLVLLTSWAVGITTSFWLVPLYLAAMGWLLLGAPPNLPKADVAVVNQIEDPGPAETSEKLTDETISPAVPVEEPKTKAKKTRTRKPKAKAKPEEPMVATVATWVQVTPGKFVRVEVAAPPETDVIPLPDEDPAAEIGEAKDQNCPLSADAEIGSSEHDSSELEAEANQPASGELEVNQSEPNSSPAEQSVEDVPQDEAWIAPSAVDIPAIIEADHEPIEHHDETDPPRESRLVAIAEPSRPIHFRVSVGRSIRMRHESRPKPRRGNGRVGAAPRVVLHRA